MNELLREIVSEALAMHIAMRRLLEKRNWTRRIQIGIATCGKSGSNDIDRSIFADVVSDDMLRPRHIMSSAFDRGTCISLQYRARVGSNVKYMQRAANTPH
jgi:hypothetical protein